MLRTASKQASVTATAAGRHLTALGHPFTVVLSSAETNGDSYVFEVVSPPGFAVPPHSHEFEDEYGYVIEGNFEFQLGGRTYPATAGSVLHCPRHITHGFRNVGSAPGRVIWVSTPGANVERFFDELAALPVDAPPDIDKLLGIFAKYNISVAPPAA